MFDKLLAGYAEKTQKIIIKKDNQSNNTLIKKILKFKLF